MQISTHTVTGEKPAFEGCVLQKEEVRWVEGSWRVKGPGSTAERPGVLLIHAISGDNERAKMKARVLLPAQLPPNTPEEETKTKQV